MRSAGTENQRKAHGHGVRTDVDGRLSDGEEHSYGAHDGSDHSALGVGVESPIMGRNRLYLWLPPLVMAPLDLGMTLWGQPPEYWGGAYTICEGNPLAAQLLLLHPAAFLAAGVAWLALVVGLVTVLPRPAALTISVAVSQAHAWAAGNWVRALLPYPHVAVPG